MLFQAFRHTDFYLAKHKASFGFISLLVIGHLVDSNSFHISRKIRNTMLNFKTQTTKRQLKAFYALPYTFAITLNIFLKK